MVDVLDGFSTDNHVADGAILTLADLGPADRFWDDIEPFVERVRQLAAGKLAERELTKREEELRHVLDRLRETGGEALAFHEASDVLEWAPANFNPPAWPAVTTACAELHERLLQHSALQRVQPSNRTAERERRAQFEALEEAIVERLEMLRGLLVAPKPPAATAAAADDVQQNPEESVDVAADDQVHAALDPEAEQYSVFTGAEERRLAAPQPGVCLVFASTATGLDSVGASMAGIQRRRIPLVEVPRAVQPADFARWMKANAPMGDRGVPTAWQRLGRWSTELGSGLRHLLEAQGTGSFRTVLVGGPAEARAFLSLDERDQVVARLDAIVPCARWQLPAIEQRIRDAQLDAGSSGAADVMATTRGWHRLLDVLWARKSSKRLDSMISAFDRTFHSPGGYSGFRAALGLAAFPEAEIVFALMARGNYSPRPPAEVPRWVIDRGAGIAENTIADAITFLIMFQLLEVDSAGHVAPDPVAREVMKSEL